jgi:photosystem II stability/assembly factor-like uncharacterized protein
MKKHFSAAVRLATLSLAIAAAATAAGGCKKKSGGGGGGGGSWLVGDDGLMANVRNDGTMGPGYELDADTDLLSITCWGLDTAFVVGEQGTLLRTFDGGENWESIETGTLGALRAVASGSGEVVYAAGDGTFLVSHDSAATLTQVAGAPEQRWISLGTDQTGAVALALAADGTVWRYQDAGGSMTQVATVAGASSVAMSRTGAVATIAGADGQLLSSTDGGATWSAIELGSDVDLFAAWPTDAGAIVAVGAAGTVARIGADGAVSLTTPGVGTLRAVQLNAEGHGIAGGDAGEVLVSDDGGASWRSIETGLTGTIRALDNIDPR